jgi:hypothetical protein
MNTLDNQQLNLQESFIYLNTPFRVKSFKGNLHISYAILFGVERSFTSTSRSQVKNMIKKLIRKSNNQNN